VGETLTNNDLDRTTKHGFDFDNRHFFDRFHHSLFGYFHTIQEPLRVTIGILNGWSIGTMEFTIQVPLLVVIRVLSGWSIGPMEYAMQVPHLGASSILNSWSFGTVALTIQEPLGFVCIDLYCVFGGVVHDVSLLISYYNTSQNKSKTLTSNDLDGITKQGFDFGNRHFFDRFHHSLFGYFHTIQVPQPAIGPLNGWSIGTMEFTIQVPNLVAVDILNGWSIGPMEYAMQVPRLVAIGILMGRAASTMDFTIQVPRRVAIIILNGWPISTMEFTIQEPLSFFFIDLYCVFGGVFHDVSVLISYYNTSQDKSKTLTSNDLDGITKQGFDFDNRHFFDWFHYSPFSYSHII
jgi:uncharacterized protein (DUF486 family)